MLPKFSTMTDDELMAFWKRYSRSSRKDAEALIGDRRPGFTTLAGMYAALACDMAVVIGCKRRGDEDGVRCYEEHIRLRKERIKKAGLPLPD